MKALLIIDVQKAMIECENPVYRSTQVIENIHTLVNSARLSKTPIIYVQHNEENTEFQNGSKSWEIVENVKPEVSDTIIQKTYSDAFKETSLKDILVQKKINELIIVGMQSDFCVNATSLRAVEIGYPVTIVSDAHSTFDEEISAKDIIQNCHEKWSSIITLKTTNEVCLYDINQ